MSPPVYFSYLKITVKAISLQQGAENSPKWSMSGYAFFSVQLLHFHLIDLHVSFHLKAEQRRKDSK